MQIYDHKPNLILLPNAPSALWLSPSLRGVMLIILGILFFEAASEWLYALLLKPSDGMFESRARTLIITSALTFLYFATCTVSANYRDAMEAKRDQNSVSAMARRLRIRYGRPGFGRHEVMMMTGAGLLSITLYISGYLLFNIPSPMLLGVQSLIFLLAFVIRNRILSRQALMRRLPPMALYLRSFSSDKNTNSGALEKFLQNLQPALRQLMTIEASLYINAEFL